MQSQICAAIGVTLLIGIVGCERGTPASPTNTGQSNVNAASADAVEHMLREAVREESSPTVEFGLTRAELRDACEKVEGLIAQCMREQGFEYVAADYLTVRRGMSADKVLPGMSEEEFHAKHGFGISTLYTGIPPQLAEGYSPGRVGLGERNVEIYKNLSPADQVAYNRALLGENTDATFAVAIEIQDFSRCGGCTRQAIEQVFTPEQMEATYYNPLDALLNEDPRMKAAVRKFADKMREAGFGYSHPEQVEGDVRERLFAITDGGTIPVEKLPPARREALKELQDFERRVAVLLLKLDQQLIEPAEEEIERGMFARGEAK